MESPSIFSGTCPSLWNGVALLRGKLLFITLLKSLAHCVNVEQQAMLVDAGATLVLNILMLPVVSVLHVLLPLGSY